MGVAYADGERISGMRRKGLIDTEQCLHHVADLRLAGVSVSADRFLDFRGRIFVYGNADKGGRQECHPSGLSEYQGGTGVAREKNLFHGHLAGFEFLEDGLEFPVDLGKPFDKRGLCRRVDRSVRHMCEPAPLVRVDDAETCVCESRIDPHDPHDSYPFEQTFPPPAGRI